MFEHHWEPAEATIVATRALTNWSGSPENTGGPSQSTPYEYVADVRPANQPPLRATFRDPYIRGHMRHPREGQVVNVLFNSKSREVKLVAAEWKVSPGEQQREAEQDWQQIADAPPQSGEPGGVRIVQGERRIPPPGPSGSDAVRVIGGERQSGGASVADELAKFADLHARGVLSDDEFEAQKAKLLAQD